METLGTGKLVTQFRTPAHSLGQIGADVVGKLIAAATDVAIIIDADGVVEDVASHSEELAELGKDEWVGRPWIDTVTVESRAKVEAMLADAGGESPRPRQVNHPVLGGTDIPVLYSAVPVGEGGRIVAVGRDLRPVAVLQQRLVEAQQSMEREYSRLRHAETRYRLLFHLASEAVVIVDAANLKVIDANPATADLIGTDTQRLVGKSMTDIFEPASHDEVRALLATVRAAGRGQDIQARLAGTDRELRVTASLFRQDRSSHFLVRLGALQVGSGAIIVPRTKSRLLSVVENLPDGFVVAGLDRRILTVNRAFLDMTQLASEELARGEPLDRWLGRSGVDFNVLVASLREHGSVQRFMTVVRGEYGSAEDVEVSAVSVATGDQPCFGFTIRHAGRRQAHDVARSGEVQQSVSQLTELVGRVSLKDLVRETTDVVERLCIEAALELTADNRASAAEMLGLSRQSLYAKLRRYGLGDLDGDDED
ncbi:transcriptional regulator PpsR [uncultured Enterovirga sp.]|uniref:transcriptional regulator PpsR n=1 Tax=uncultured Enterovirga sp. TaxID=2026352 RepID=UPI0035C999B6